MHSMEQARAHVWITGRVQGVGFRANTRDQARACGVNGWVRNLADGRVEALFEGPKPAVEQVVAWCSNGSSPARVSHVELLWEAPTGNERSFQIVW